MLADFRFSDSGFKSNHSRRIEQMQEPLNRTETGIGALLT